MKKNSTSPIGVIVIHIAATLFNFTTALSYSQFPLTLLCFIITLLYIYFWIQFITKGKYPKAGIVVYIVMLLLYISGFIIGKLQIDIGWFMMPYFLLTPLVGFDLLGNTYFTGVCTIAVCIFMIVLSLKYSREKYSNMKYKER